MRHYNKSENVISLKKGVDVRIKDPKYSKIELAIAFLFTHPTQISYVIFYSLLELSNHQSAKKNLKCATYLTRFVIINNHCTLLVIINLKTRHVWLKYSEKNSKVVLNLKKRKEIGIYYYFFLYNCFET